MRYQTRETINNIIWVVLFLLLIPSSLAVASWNSLPGSGLFRIKLTMEEALVALAPTEETKGNLGQMFTERRVNEATRLLADRGSGEGLSYLNAQVLASTERIQKTNNAKVQARLAQEYITTLQNANVQLEQQKQLLVSSQAPGTANTGSVAVARRPVNATGSPVRTPPSSGNPNPQVTYAYGQGGYTPPTLPTAVRMTYMPTPTPTPVIAAQPTVGTPEPIPVPEPDPIEAIEEAQEQIEEAIEELQQASSFMPTVTPSPTQLPLNTSDRRDESDEDEGNGDQGRGRNSNQNNGPDNNNEGSGDHDEPEAERENN